MAARPSGSPARRALALAAGKAAGHAVRLLGAGGGTSLPGRVARAVDGAVPEVVGAVVGAVPLDAVVDEDGAVVAVAGGVTV